MYENYLAHYGVLGMRWGHRSSRSNTPKLTRAQKKDKKLTDKAEKISKQVGFKVDKGINRREVAGAIYNFNELKAQNLKAASDNHVSQTTAKGKAKALKEYNDIKNLQIKSLTREKAINGESYINMNLEVKK